MGARTNIVPCGIAPTTDREKAIEEHVAKIMPFLMHGGRKKFRKASLDAEIAKLECKPREVSL